VNIRGLIIKMANDGLYYSGAYRLLQRTFSGVGCIFALHKVCSEAEWNKFGPLNRYLSITEKTLTDMIETLTGLDYDFVTMSSVRARLQSGEGGRRFACLTFDDGYRDNYTGAFRICQRFRIPMVVYIATGIVDGTFPSWWRGVESLLNGCVSVLVPGDKSASVRMAARTSKEKQACYARLTRIFASAPIDEHGPLLDRLARENEFDLWSSIHSLALDWELIREMHESGIVEFGAHTVNHVALAPLSEDRMRREMEESGARLSRVLQAPVRHFSYPYGGRQQAGEREFRVCRELGFETAVTTRHGTVMASDRNAIHSLPRLTLNGYHARTSTVKVFASGTYMALRNGFRVPAPWLGPVR
jgi:peptidoglycan/xylan/chitin deacetylase (PgdA/CDA1 family)